jgi:hypothetical protein
MHVNGKESTLQYCTRRRVYGDKELMASVVGLLATAARLLL